MAKELCSIWRPASVSCSVTWFAFIGGDGNEGKPGQKPRGSYSRHIRAIKLHPFAQVPLLHGFRPMQIFPVQNQYRGLRQSEFADIGPATPPLGDRSAALNGLRTGKKVG